ncbi:DUF221-domain-containing protein [Tilletiaria anomala UBC 951]|uniref:DUF221-domain-containing protein n=1 Tax=Tilletiaria anomala (strain ATCC 24038 / CBS 436.72 / UBC 951) TaxID=1037660 RepID=A0A066WIK5_TILAU|nr:DUF221-domain-containing protein [Tilletiaria anomala UBC 951]KDN52353.1 DUF221-domain-containing protein [Tilletiaria anomala UBC 951]
MTDPVSCSDATANLKGPAGQIVCALNQQSNVAARQVGIAVGAFAALGAVTLFGFQVLRPNNKIVYAPKSKYAEEGRQPPRVGDGFFDWVKPVLQWKEQDLLPILGLDAIAYLRFGRMMRWMATVLAVVMCVVLMPVDILYNLNKSSSNDSLQYTLTIITMREVKGSYVWAHVAMGYIGTIIALTFVYFNYRAMVRLRWQYFRSEEYQTAYHARTLMITNVSKRLQSDQALSSMLSTLKMPYPTTEVHIGRETGLLPDLIEKHQDLVRKLERVLAKYLKNPGKVSGKRPTVTLNGWLGLGGETVDAIDFYTAQINKTEAAIEGWRERISDKKPQNYGFASLAAVPYAHAAAKSLQSKKPGGLRIQLAPSPHAIIWRNLTMSSAERFRRSTIGFIVLLVLLFVNAVPLLAVSLISNMALFIDQVGFLGSWHSASSWSFAAVAGLLPPLISGLAGYLLPILMRRIAKYRGLQTKIKADKIILTQYFGYLVVSQFLVFTLLGIGINLVIKLVNNIQEKKAALQILRELGKENLLNQIKTQYFVLGNYWLTWLPFRGYMIIFDLAQVIKLLLVWVQKGFFGRTPRDVRELTRPPFFEYSIYYSNLLFMAAVVMLYAALVPLVTVLGAAGFWMSSLVCKYQLMFVCQTKHETGGSLWRIVINRLYICIVMMQIILALAVLLDQTGQWYRTIACLPPILMVIGFKIYTARVFDSQYKWYIPNAQEMAGIVVHKGDARHHRLQRRFGHPSLHEKLWTPMVHAKVQHLLPNVYRGRLDATSTQVVDGRKMKTQGFEGGLKLALVEEDQLEYDPKKDLDSRSVMSGTTIAAGMSGYGTRPPSPGTPYTGVGAYGASTSSFKAQYANYLAGAPQTPGDEYELSDVHHGGNGYGPGRESRDNLLDQPSARYSDSADGTLVGSGHIRKRSGDMYKAVSNGGHRAYENVPSQRTASQGDPMVAGYGMVDHGLHPDDQSAAMYGYQQRPGPPVRQDSNFTAYSGGGYQSAQTSPQGGPLRVGAVFPPPNVGTMDGGQHPHQRSGSTSSGYMLQQQQVSGPPMQPGMVFSQAPYQPARYAQTPPPATFVQSAPGQYVQAPVQYHHQQQHSASSSYDPYAMQRRQSPGPQRVALPSGASDGSAPDSYSYSR